MGNKTAGRNRDLAHVRGLPLGHAKATGLLSCGGKIRRNLGTSVRQRPFEETENERSG
jgi:hypothetical protein